MGYCNVVDGCKIVAEGLVGVNGIAKGKDGKYYVASSTSGRVYVFDRQADNSLVLEDEISTGKRSLSPYFHSSVSYPYGI